jgi:hypothetical protein
VDVFGDTSDSRWPSTLVDAATHDSRCYLRLWPTLTSRAGEKWDLLPFVSLTSA